MIMKAIGENKAYGFLAAKGLSIECLGSCIPMRGCKQYNNLLNKFPDDKVLADTDKHICFLDGYVYNKADYMQENAMSWQAAFTEAMQQDVVGSLKKLRGGFCGYFLDKQQDIVYAYVDSSAVKSLYYFVSGDKWILSNHIDYMVEVLKANQMMYDFNPLAAKYMLTYGYMIDDSTFVKQIHRILPGQYIRMEKGQVIAERYHFVKNTESKMSEEEAVEKLDAAFREAVRREFEKDREYGYRHLVDLSGGLDSRMVSWAAHDMGYTDQVNFTYSRMNYYDESISKQIAAYLGHEYLFKPLEDLKWMYDLEEITSQNNGAALYTGITGGMRTLKLLRMNQFGMEHTGMLGDVIIGTYHDKETAHSRPVFGMNAYSDKLKYQFDDKILEAYPCQEMFCIYTRGMLGMASTYMIRQHFVETSSPFMDVDFMDIVFSLPFAYRYKHYIYLKWMKEKYPKAADFGWEKWGGIKPKESHIFFRKVKTTQRLLRQALCRAFNIENSDSMSPEDYWYRHDDNVQRFFETYYADNIGMPVIDEELRNDMKNLFQNGNVAEKSMALTVLAMVKKYFI